MKKRRRAKGRIVDPAYPVFDYDRPIDITPGFNYGRPMFAYGRPIDVTPLYDYGRPAFNYAGQYENRSGNKLVPFSNRSSGTVRPFAWLSENVDGRRTNVHVPKGENPQVMHEAMKRLPQAQAVLRAMNRMSSDQQVRGMSRRLADGTMIHARSVVSGLAPSVGQQVIIKPPVKPVVNPEDFMPPQPHLVRVSGPLIWVGARVKSGGEPSAFGNIEFLDDDPFKGNRRVRLFMAIWEPPYTAKPNADHGFAQLSHRILEYSQNYDPRPQWWGVDPLQPDYPWSHYLNGDSPPNWNDTNALPIILYENNTDHFPGGLPNFTARGNFHVAYTDHGCFVAENDSYSLDKPWSTWPNLMAVRNASDIIDKVMAGGAWETVAIMDPTKGPNDKRIFPERIAIEPITQYDQATFEREASEMLALYPRSQDYAPQWNEDALRGQPIYKEGPYAVRVAVTGMDNAPVRTVEYLGPAMTYSDAEVEVRVVAGRGHRFIDKTFTFTVGNCYWYDAVVGGAFRATGVPRFEAAPQRYARDNVGWTPTIEIDPFLGVVRTTNTKPWGFM